MPRSVNDNIHAAAGAGATTAGVVNEADTDHGGLKPPPLPDVTTEPSVAKSPKLKTLQRSLKSTIQFKSDLSKSTRSTWSCGVLHASISTTAPVVGRVNSSAAAAAASSSGSGAVKEEHCFVWISNLFHLDKALAHLAKFGFYHDPSSNDVTSSISNSDSNVTFIPYSSRSNWCYKYPMAFPNVHVDLEGNVSGYPYWSSDGIMAQNAGPSSSGVKSGGATTLFKLNSATTPSSATTPTTTTFPPGLPPLPTTAIGTANNERLFPNASLTNEARSQLHSQIYSYFSWYKTELMIQSSMMMGPDGTTTTVAGGAATNNMNQGLIHGIGGLLNLMETTFGDAVSSHNAKKRKASSSQGMMAMMVAEDTPPLLESGLIDPLNQLVAEAHIAENDDDDSSSSPKRRKTQKSARSSGAGSGGNAPLDFDDMYNRLLTFKAQFGHVNVPQGYKEDKQLGSWVTNIRYKRKCLQKMGQEYEVEEDDDTDLLVGGGMDDAMPDFDAAATAMGIDLGLMSSSKKKDGMAISAANKPKRKKKRLSQERVALLDQIGFAWSHDKQYKSWDERFNDLVEYKRVHGNTRVPRSSGSLGEWVHMQRKMYHKNEKNFMAKRAPRLEAIGFEWRTRKYDLVSWDDNFQNLVKFGTENQHYNVPAPIDTTQEGVVAPLTPEQEEANRFYKWVKRTRAEYKSLMGGKSSRMLNEERVAKLRQIGFIV